MSQSRSYGGWQEVYRHDSTALNCSMQFALYLPPDVKTRPSWTLYWLSGLTCTEQNFITKSGFQRWAAHHNAIVVAPDTSPRGDRVPDVADRWDLGQGAGFYVNATEAPWDAHYHMYDYIVEELPQTIAPLLPTPAGRTAIAGHSMGGLGALTIGLRNRDRYASISAFAPIVNPSDIAWGEDAFSHYLGRDRDAWAAYDPCQLIRSYTQRHGSSPSDRPPLLIDQGTADGFLHQQLQPNAIAAAGADSHYPIKLRMQPDYDHSYYFVATFLEDHFAHHAAHCAP